MKRTVGGKLLVGLVLVLLGSLATCVLAETVVVKPGNLADTGWVIATQTGAVSKEGQKSTPYAKWAFEKPWKKPLAGAGSIHLMVGYSAKAPLSKVYLGTNKLKGVALDKITQLKLWICPRWRGYHKGQPGQVEIAVSGKTETQLLTYYPWGRPAWENCGITNWQEFDLMAKDGIWVWTTSEDSDNEGNWDWVLSQFKGAQIVEPAKEDWPKGTISGAGFNFKIGAAQPRDRQWQEASGCNAYVDKVTLGYRDKDGKEVVTTYDFEPE